jgi:hypothetical protein
MLLTGIYVLRIPKHSSNVRRLRLAIAEQVIEHQVR